MKTGPIVGTEVGGYRVEGVAGRGGMSIVFLAEHLRLGRKVALKILAPELADDEAFRDRFVRESRIAAALEHPNVIPIFDAGEDDGFLYIAMRYVDGTDLRELIEQEGALPPRRAHGIVAQVAGALDAAHARGLIHRDVKPGNVLINPVVDTNQINHVYLTDFGLVKETISTPALTRPGQFVGTIPYVSPEQIQGKTVDHRADVYSLGCMLFECLTAQQPFQRDDDVAVMWAHVNDDPPSARELRPELAPSVDDVVAKAMAKSPDARYQTCRELAIAAGQALKVSGDYDLMPEPSTTDAAAAVVTLSGPGGSESLPAASVILSDGTLTEPEADAATAAQDVSAGAPPSTNGGATLTEQDEGPAGTTVAAGLAAATLAASTVTSDATDAVTVQDAPIAADTVPAGDEVAQGTVQASGLLLPEAPADAEAPAPSLPPSQERPRRTWVIVALVVALLLIAGAAIAIPMLSGDEGGGQGTTSSGETGSQTGSGGDTLATVGSIEPESGGIGTDITITGTGLGEVTGVEVGGEPTSFDVVSDSEVTATVPDGATTGRISVTTPAGTVVSTSDFVVIEPVESPRALRVTDRATSYVRLAWKRASSGGRADYFVVYRDGEVYARRIQKVTFTDANVTPGTTYTYRVVAVGVDGSEARSESLRVTVPVPVPEPTSAPPSSGPPPDDGVCSFEEYLNGECEL